MSASTALLLQSAHPQAERAPWLADVLETLDSMVVSAEPAVVFSSVAWLCVPLMCDAVTVTISEADRAPYGIRWPWPETGDPALYPVDTVTASFRIPPTDHDAGYHGVLALHFHDLRPDASHAVLAQLIAERTLDVIERERLADTVRAQQQRGDTLEVALHGSRSINSDKRAIDIGSRSTPRTLVAVPLSR